jgi:hypothetical protein
MATERQQLRMRAAGPMPLVRSTCAERTVAGELDGVLVFVLWRARSLGHVEYEGRHARVTAVLQLAASPRGSRTDDIRKRAAEELADDATCRKTRRPSAARRRDRRSFFPFASSARAGYSGRQAMRSRWICKSCAPATSYREKWTRRTRNTCRAPENRSLVSCTRCGSPTSEQMFRQTTYTKKNR